MAVHQECAHNIDINTMKLHRLSSISLKTARFKLYRIRKAIKPKSSGLLKSGVVTVGTDAIIRKHQT